MYELLVKVVGVVFIGLVGVSVYEMLCKVLGMVFICWVLVIVMEWGLCGIWCVEVVVELVWLIVVDVVVEVCGCIGEEVFLFVGVRVDE